MPEGYKLIQREPKQYPDYNSKAAGSRMRKLLQDELKLRNVGSMFLRNKALV